MFIVKNKGFLITETVLCVLTLSPKDTINWLIFEIECYLGIYGSVHQKTLETELNLEKNFHPFIQSLYLAIPDVRSIKDLE